AARCRKECASGLERHLCHWPSSVACDSDFSVLIRGTHKTYAVLTLLLVGVLLYLELYPFIFRVPADGEGALRKLIGSGAERPSRGDLLANILAYIPLGFCATSVGIPRNRAGRFVLVAFSGLILSVGFELTQYFVDGRMTAATDVYANTIGVVLGSVAAIIWTTQINFVLRIRIVDNPIPYSLLLAWMAYRLYPYVPTTDLH